MNCLVFNGTKTKTRISSTRQTSRYHHLDKAGTYSIVLNGNEAENRFEEKYSMKILGMKVDQHLTREEHVATVMKPSYDTLRSLKFLKRYSSYKLGKTAYGSVIYQNVPNS